MAQLIPFNGTVAQLYQQYGSSCFVGLFMNNPGTPQGGVGVAGYAFPDGIAGSYSFNAGGWRPDPATNIQLKGYVVIP